jgi:hypothetical protein
MTQDEILDMWGRAGGGAIKNMPYSLVERFAALVAAAEREACAKEAESWDGHLVAAEIRSRGQA